MIAMSKKDVVVAGEVLFDAIKELSESRDITLTPTKRFEAAVPYCRGFLEALGFKVVSPMTYRYDNINEIKQLIDFFYSTFNYMYPKEITPTREHHLDLKIAEELLSRLTASGDLTRKQALRDAAQIIEVVLSTPKKFDKIFSIGFKMFTQEKMSWVTERALEIINNTRSYQTSVYFDRLNDLCNETYEGEIGFNLDELEENDNGRKEKK